jgi:flagellar M-ring protein FliF
MADATPSGTGLAAPGGAAGGALERVSAVATDLRGRIQAMPPQRRTWMGASALLVAAICAGMVWYAGRTDWRLLFSGLDSKDTQQIAQELSAAGIPFQMTADGTGVQVGADQVDKARMEVAAKGMPQSGRMGFELFDKPNWVGSEFDEKVNYQRALEGELEHTIGTLAVVRSARVHLVLPKESLFAEQEQPAKASVVLQLRKSLLAPEQAEAIRSLVAGAVENLGTDQVTLVDADGRLNLSAHGQDAVAGDAERELEGKLVAMLEPTAGGGNVHASVTVAYNQGSEEKTDEVYDPSQVVATSLHKSEQTMGSRIAAGGVPGTASNTPGAAVPGSVQAAGRANAAAAVTPAPVAVPPLMQTASAASGVPNAAVPGLSKSGEGAHQEAGLPVYSQNGSQPGETITEETGSYAVTRHMSHSEEGPGQVRRLTAAVVVNDRRENEGAGKLAHAVWRPRSPEEMQRLEQLARAAVGFDAARGDQLVVENVGFSSNAPEPDPPAIQKALDQTDALLHTQPDLMKTLSFSVVAVLLVMTVVKPVAKHMMTALSQAPLTALPAGAATTGRIAGGSPGVRNFGASAGIPAKRPTDTQEIYEHLSEQIRREPAQSTRLLESWINAPVEDDE